MNGHRPFQTCLSIILDVSMYSPGLHAMIDLIRKELLM